MSASFLVSRTPITHSKVLAYILVKQMADKTLSFSVQKHFPKNNKSGAESQ